MVDEKSGQDIRTCGAPGCDNPVGNDNRRRFCSMRCSNRVHNDKTKGRRKLEKLGRVCAIEGCNHPVVGRRSRYCSDECASKAYHQQVREASKRKREKKRRSSKSKPERRKLEVRAIRGMQQVPVERWGEYEFKR